MIKRILTVKYDRFFLEKECFPIDETSCFGMLQDLEDTISVAENCAGLALNQIGYNKAGFAMKYGKKILYVFNPEVVKLSPKKTISCEGCLSLPSEPTRRIMRHKSIKIKFYNPKEKSVMTMNFKGFDAFVVQHEMDHAKGILI